MILKVASKLKQIDHLLPLIEKPVSSCVLVLTDQQIDQRRKFFKVLAQNGAVVNCATLKEMQLPSWIQRVADQFGKKVDLKSCQLLLSLVGPSMLDIHNEIMKLVQFVGQRQQITINDIQNAVSKQCLASVFDLVNALGSYKALILLKSLLYQGQNELGILAMLARQIRILILIKEAQVRKLSSFQISQKVGVPSYFLNQYLKQGRYWNFQQLRAFHALLLETDKKFKKL